MDQQLNFHLNLYQLILFDYLFTFILDKVVVRLTLKFIDRITHAKIIEFAKLEDTFTIA
jgi:hypothetical protein